MSNPWTDFVRLHRNRTGLSGPALFKSASLHYRKQKGGGGGLAMKDPPAAAAEGGNVVFIILQDDIKHLVTRSKMPKVIPPGFSAVKATLDQQYAAAPAAHPNDDEIGVAPGTELYVVIQTVSHGQHKKVIYVSEDYKAAQHVSINTPIAVGWNSPRIIKVKVGENWIIDFAELLDHPVGYRFAEDHW